MGAKEPPNLVQVSPLKLALLKLAARSYSAKGRKKDITTCSIKTYNFLAGFGLEMAGPWVLGPMGPMGAPHGSPGTPGHPLESPGALKGPWGPWPWRSQKPKRKRLSYVLP